MSDHTDRPNRDWNLDKLRDWLRPRLERPDGVTCPVCTQHAQAYKRVVTRAMVGTMKLMLDAAMEKGHRAAWVKLSHIPQKTRDTATLQYWALIREHGEKRGWWQVTDAGYFFLTGSTKIDKYAHVYNGKQYAFSGEQVSVYDVDPEFQLHPVKGEDDD